MTALDYIQSKGLAFKRSAGQLILEVCPFCQDTKGHFYLDPEEGRYFCHKCQERGNLFTLQKHFGDTPTRPPGHSGNRPGAQATRETGHRSGVAEAFPKDQAFKKPDPTAALKAHHRLLNDPEALGYVTGRGISPEAVDHFKLGLNTDLEGARWLTIPHYIGGDLVNIKSRSLPPAEKDFKRVKDCRSVLFNADAIEGAEELYLTEGEIDAITLWDQGIKNVVATTTGAGSFDPAWVDLLKPVKKIYLVYDPDEPGQKGAREVARRLGYGRTFNVLLPDGRDMNEFFQSGKDLFDFQAIVNQAERFEVSGVMGIEQGLRRYLKDSKRQIQSGIMTPWPAVNRLIPTGFQAGELIVLSAPPKIGKSSLALQIAWGCALKDIPALFYCLEMRPMKLIEKIVKSFNRTATVDDGAINATRRGFHEKPLYLGYCYQKPERDKILETLKDAVQRFGLKLLAFDHLHFLCRSLSNQVQEIGLAVQGFKFLAEEMEIPIILIAQPRKIEAGAVMTAQDLKDSSSIYSDCDHLLIMHRRRLASDGKKFDGTAPTSQAFDSMTLIRVEASRYNPGGEAVLKFHGEYSRFDENEES
jgi:twinkle protein